MENWIKIDDDILISHDNKIMIIVDKEYLINNISGMPYLSKKTHKIIYLDSDNKMN